VLKVVLFGSGGAMPAAALSALELHALSELQ